MAALISPATGAGLLIPGVPDRLLMERFPKSTEFQV